MFLSSQGNRPGPVRYSPPKARPWTETSTGNALKAPNTMTTRKLTAQPAAADPWPGGIFATLPRTVAIPCKPYRNHLGGMCEPLSLDEIVPAACTIAGMLDAPTRLKLAQFARALGAACARCDASDRDALHTAIRAFAPLPVAQDRFDVAQDRLDGDIAQLDAQLAAFASDEPDSAHDKLLAFAPIRDASARVADLAARNLVKCDQIMVIFNARAEREDAAGELAPPAPHSVTPLRRARCAP